MEGVSFPPEVRNRLDALEQLIDTKYDGSVATFCERTGIKTAQINQWFSGYRMLRERALERLAAATGKTPAWFNEGVTYEKPGATQVKHKVENPRAGWAAEISAATCTQLLGGHIAAADTLTRSQIAPLLASLVEAPDRAPELGARLQATLAMSPGYTPPALPGLATTHGQPPNLPAVVARAPARADLETCFERLAQALQAAPPAMRQQASAELADLALNPDGWRSTLAHLRALGL